MKIPIVACRSFVVWQPQVSLSFSRATASYVVEAARTALREPRGIPNAVRHIMLGNTTLPMGMTEGRVLPLMRPLRRHGGRYGDYQVIASIKDQTFRESFIVGWHAVRDEIAATRRASVPTA